MKRWILLENIRSLHNVGSIFRSSDGAGFSRIFLGGYTGNPPDRRIEKVSLGAEDFIEWEAITNILDFVLKTKKDGLHILALEKTKFSRNILELKAENIPKNILLVVGNEVEGVSQEILDIADTHWHIPMYGEKESLNVSVAAGVAMYAINGVR